MIVTLDQVKAHLRIDGTDEDAYLATLQAGAEAAVLNYLKPTKPVIKVPPR